MDEQLLTTINRQLRAIKVMLGLFFIMLLTMLVVLGFIAYKVIMFTHDVSTKITNFENKTTHNLDLKNQLCDNKSVTSLLGNSSSICK